MAVRIFSLQLPHWAHRLNDSPLLLLPAPLLPTFLLLAIALGSAGCQGEPVVDKTEKEVPIEGLYEV